MRLAKLLLLLLLPLEGCHYDPASISRRSSAARPTLREQATSQALQPA